jgi:hypothetical protein
MWYIYTTRESTHEIYKIYYIKRERLHGNHWSTFTQTIKETTDKREREREREREKEIPLLHFTY